MSALHNQIPVVLEKKDEINPLITRFTFRRRDGENFPPFSGGSHIVVEMEDHGKIHRNPYSLMSDPHDLSCYQISVRRDDEGRGGSLFMHNETKEGMKMNISYPINLFSLDLRAKKHLMIAGGIGITPFLSQIKQLQHGAAPFELHYLVRNAKIGAYAQELKERYPFSVHIYLSDEGERAEFENILAGQRGGTHLYVCGPMGLTDKVIKLASDLDWPADHVHSEEFTAPPRGTAFKVHLSKSNIDIEVGPDDSLLEAIEAAGIDPPYLCRGGACGQCETQVLEAKGTIQHNDHWLTDEQRKEAKLIMPCVSRFEGELLVIDR